MYYLNSIRLMALCTMFQGDPGGKAEEGDDGDPVSINIYQ